LGEEARALAERSGDVQALRWASGVMAELDVLEECPEAAAARLVPLLDRSGLEECDVTALLPVLAWAYLEQGQGERAAETVERVLVRARRGEIRYVLVDALRVQAMIALRQERWGDAACSLEEGLALARCMPYPYAEARLLQVDGLLHAQKGEPEAARERLEAALAIFQRLGARKDAERTEQAITALPNAPRGDAALHSGAIPGPRHELEAAAPAGPHLSRPERQAWALERLRADGALSPRLYAAALGVSLDTALRDLSALAQQGQAVARGTTKDRRYVLRRPVG
jgi:tetratricopeptide (TPR) repeat protein